ncbi:MAG: NAD-dependent epimerase/dehydratase family protein [Lentisphaerae bacterium]|nr:NAD-dependent epimerase/dehydratase family protein [Lentisphaerota bacterium]
MAGTQGGWTLVTGAGGYVGGALAADLARRGERVRAMVRDRSAAGALEKLGIPVVEADVRDAASLAPALEGVVRVHHIAALFRQAGFPESVFHDINAEGTRRMLEASIAAGARRFIHCSTGGVLGDVRNPPGTETSPYNPGDMYQRTKLEGEKIAMEAFRSGRIRGAVIRPAMIYGPGDTRNLKMFRMIARRRFFYAGPCKHVHFIDVRDLVRAFELAMEHEEINAEVYMIAGEKAVPLNVMAEAIARNLGVPPPWLRLPVKPLQWLGSACEAVCTPLNLRPPIYRRRVDFFTKNRHFDASKAARDLGFKPARTFDDEVADIVRWYRENGWV